jgi:putative transposase
MSVYFSLGRSSAAIFDLVCKVKSRSPQLSITCVPTYLKAHLVFKYWGRRYFSTTNGAITEDIVFRCHENHTA